MGLKFKILFLLIFSFNFSLQAINGSEKKLSCFKELSNLLRSKNKLSRKKVISLALAEAIPKKFGDRISAIPEDLAYKMDAVFVEEIEKKILKFNNKQLLLLEYIITYGSRVYIEDIGASLYPNAFIYNREELYKIVYRSVEEKELRDLVDEVFIEVNQNIPRNHPLLRLTYFHELDHLIYSILKRKPSDMKSLERSGFSEEYKYLNKVFSSSDLERLKVSEKIKRLSEKEKLSKREEADLIFFTDLERALTFSKKEYVDNALKAYL